MKKRLLSVLTLGLVIVLCGCKSKEEKIQDAYEMGRQAALENSEESMAVAEASASAVRSELALREDLVLEPKEALDGLCLCDPVEEWQEERFKYNGTQICDLFIHSGQRVRDVVAYMEASGIDWEYEYDSEKSEYDDSQMIVSYQGEDVFYLEIARVDETTTMKDWIVTIITVADNTHEYARVFGGMPLTDIDTLTDEEAAQLENTLFADCCYLEKSEVEMSDGSIVHEYTIVDPCFFDIAGMVSVGMTDSPLYEEVLYRRITYSFHEINSGMYFSFLVEKINYRYLDSEGIFTGDISNIPSPEEFMQSIGN